MVLAVPTAGAVPVPHARPAPKQQPAPSPGDGITDMSKAVPLKDLLKQPSTSAQYQSLSGEIAKTKPALETARVTSEDLARQTAGLQKKLVDSAARVEFLEGATIRIDAEVVRLTGEYARLSVGFARDRVAVSLQNDPEFAVAELGGGYSSGGTISLNWPITNAGTPTYFEVMSAPTARSWAATTTATVCCGFPVAARRGALYHCGAHSCANLWIPARGDSHRGPGPPVGLPRRSQRSFTGAAPPRFPRARRPDSRRPRRRPPDQPPGGPGDPPRSG